MDKIEIVPLRGNEALKHISALAQLRIEVFREFPYLYDGTMEYEERYLRTYIESADSVIVAAMDKGEVVGASTALPMRDETAEFQQPFRDNGYDINRIFYFGESVLRKSYRGRGLGVAFFTAREAHARQVGDFDLYCFCAVARPTDHPLRPAGYQPLDHFWQKRGYVKHPELISRFKWKDIDQAEPTEKKMEFWLKHVKD